MFDDLGDVNSNLEIVKIDVEIKLEFLYKFFNGFENIEYEFKDDVFFRKLKEKFDFVFKEIVNKFNGDVEKFLEKFDFKDKDLEDFINVFDNVIYLIKFFIIE